MAIYSWRIKDMVKSYVQDPYLPMTQQIDLSLPHFFNFSYPIWAESYKPVLERKIIMKYFTKEICSEDVGEWKIFLEQRMNEIMPYYNEVYKTVSKEFEWLVDMDNSETYEGNKMQTGTINGTLTGKTTGNDTGTSTTNIIDTGETVDTSKAKDLKSDLPQANYNNLDYGTSLNEIDTTGTNKSIRDSSTNATNTLDSTSEVNTNNNTSTNANANDTYSRIRKGLSGSRSLTQLNVEYRESLINIDKMIVDELKDLFMTLWR